MLCLKLTPAFKDYIWGGTKLRDDFNKNCDYEKIAESWELSCHEHGLSVIENGEYAGKTLREYVDNNPNALGTNCKKYNKFPLLIKLIDAKADLSIQVHPNDNYAMQFDDYGKTEMWYIIEADEGAEIIYGFNQELTKDEFRRRIEENTLIDVVNKIKVKKGDMFTINAGTLHAIGKGIMLAEVQQNSDLTYRVYDYARIDKDGKQRELHIDKAVDVTDLHKTDLAKVNPKGKKKYREINKYFKAEIWNVIGKAKLEANAKSFTAITVINGEIDINGLLFKKGETCFIPANENNAESVILTAVNKKYISGKTTLLVASAN